MPCPPTWEEIELGKVYEARRAADLQIESVLGPHLLPALEVVEALRGRAAGPSLEGLEDLEKCLAFSQKVRESGLPAYEVPAPEPASDNFDVVLAHSWSEAAFRADLAAKLELCLCVFGTFVARFVRDHGVPAGLLDDVGRELSRHEAHREAERAERLAELEREAAKIRGEIDRLPPNLGELGTIVVAGIQQRIDEKVAVIERVRAIDALTLCTDRCALGDAARE